MVELKQEPQKLTAFLSGELDHHHAKEIRETIDFAVREQYPPVVVLDFRQVSFMDSSGIGLIMGRSRLMEEYGGTFPQTYDELVKLPGIGEYTAGAIASICFDEKVPAVDGNVLRVIARVQGSKENVLLPQTKKSVTEQLKKIMPRHAGAFNEGLMELGELICLPNGAPLCDSCPLKEHCTAYKKGLTEQLPVRVKKMKRRRADKTVCYLTAADGKIAIEKRPDTGLLSGMYQLPNIEGFHTEEALRTTLREWGLDPTDITFTKEAKHVFTHIDWYMKAYHINVKEQNDRFIWVTEDELKSSYPLPTAFQKLL